MNPSNPTRAEVRNTERLFLAQMQMLSRRAARDPLRSFDEQCSDSWIGAA